MFGWLTGMDGKRRASVTTKQHMKTAAKLRAAGIKKAPKIKKLKVR